MQELPQKYQNQKLQYKTKYYIIYVLIDGETTIRSEPIVGLEKNMYPDLYYKHQPKNVQIDETLQRSKPKSCK